MKHGTLTDSTKIRTQRQKRLAFLAFSLLAILAFPILMSCYEPSPLYGTWMDNLGNEMRFVSDGSEFNAKINWQITENGETATIKKMYQGTYSTIDNALSLDYTNTSDPTDSGTQNTEYDIRGAMLYLYWTTRDGRLLLTLYHTAK